MVWPESVLCMECILFGLIWFALFLLLLLEVMEEEQKLQKQGFHSLLCIYHHFHKFQWQYTTQFVTTSEKPVESNGQSCNDLWWRCSGLRLGIMLLDKTKERKKVSKEGHLVVSKNKVIGDFTGNNKLWSVWPCQKTNNGWNDDG